jgi:hypothetical protein
MMLMQLGSMPPELVKKSTELFARECMPYLRDMWTDYEDKWSANPMPASERAIPAPVDFELKLPKHTNGHTRPNGATADTRSAK